MGKYIPRAKARTPHQADQRLFERRAISEEEYDTRTQEEKAAEAARGIASRIATVR